MSKDYVETTMLTDEHGEVNIDGYVHYETERNYGEDADGNRGVVRSFITEVSEVSAYDMVTDDEIELSPSEYEKASKELADKWNI